jgi:hypothetical protein
MYSSRVLTPAFLCVLLCSALAFSQGTSATLSGTVTDTRGAVVPGAGVTVKNTENGQQRQAQSNDSGNYRVVGLPPGSYEVRVERQGFNAEVRKVKLTVAEEGVLDVPLAVSGVTESVVVTEGGAAQVETANSTLSAVVDDKKIRDLPLNGRDMAQLILLQPGVVNSRASTQSANTGRGTRFSVSGARPSQNLFQLDGTTLNDALNNTPGSAQGLLVGVETVKEFRVLTNSYGAEYGRAAGGIFLAITKSGTNEFSGSLFEFLRNDNVDARNFFDAQKPEFRRNQFGFTLGGPVVKNKTFFFGSYEGLREFKGITSVSVVPDDNARLGVLPTGNVAVDARSRPLVDLFPRANGRNLGSGTAEFIGTTNRVSRDDFFTVRVDHTISNSDSFFVRYLFDDSDQVIPRFFPQFPNQAINRKQVVTIEERKIISSNMVNEARFGFNRSTPAELVPTNSSSVEMIAGRGLGELNVTGLTPVGTDRTNPKLFFQNNFQFVDNLAYMRGSHSLKMGFNFDYFQFNGRSESRTRGRLRFRGLQQLLRFQVRDLEGSSITSDFARSFRQSLTGFYFQDDYKATRRLTLNLGLRYEFATSPSETHGRIANLRSVTDPAVTVGAPFFKPTRLALSPRVGFAYDVFGDGKTALRGGFGVFQDHPLFNVYRSAAFGSLPFILTARLTTVTALPVDPTRFTTGVLATEAVEFQMRPSYVMQYNLNVQREVTRGTVVTAAYVGSRGVNLFGQGDTNTAVPQIVNGVEFFPAGSTRRNPTFDSIRKQIQGFNSWYNAMNLGLVRRFSHDMQFQVSYTFGKSLDERSGTSGRQEFANGQARTFDPYDRHLDKARSDFDVRHSFVANMTYEVPWGRNSKGWVKQLVGGYQLNTIVTMYSGAPFSVFVDGDPDRDATDDNAARPNLIPGVNLYPSQRTPDQWFNPAAFGVPIPGFRGSSGRNILTGPDYKSVDFSLVKDFPIGEKRRLQFRAEVFNLFNRANFDLPSNADDGEQVFGFVTNPAATVPCIAGTRTTASCFTTINTAGKIFSTNGDAREVQFGLKFIF